MSPDLEISKTSTITLDDLALEALPQHVVAALDAVDLKFKDLREYTSNRPRARIVFSNGKLVIHLRIVLSGPQILVLLSVCGVSGIALSVIRHILGF